MSSRIALGAIRKPHGVRGEASVELWTEFERFSEVHDVTLVSPDESNTPEEMALFRDWTIEIPESEARKPEADEYFLHDLIGLTLVDESGAERGRVTDAYEGGGGVLLEVEHGPRKFEVPFATEICKTIDIAGKRIVVDLPQGLDDL
jgi:16S rRNA processing protein RimM